MLENPACVCWNGFYVICYSSSITKQKEKKATRFIKEQKFYKKKLQIEKKNETKLK